jgi:hypothetical protein
MIDDNVVCCVLCCVESLVWCVLCIIMWCDVIVM